MMTREDMLRELELLPTWQLRVPLKTAEVPATAPDKPLAVSAAPVVTEPLVFLEPPVLLEHATQMDWSGLQQCVQNCQACGLAQTRTQTVFGTGDPDADWLFVGEAPGVEEDHQGEPFVGQAGKLLDNMLAAIQLKRDQNVFIANVLKCRPPENRDPHHDEITQCEPYLKRQVELIQPKLIIALGKVAAQTLLNSNEAVSHLRGQLHHYHGVPVIVTYHPAYLLRNLADKAKAWEDLCFAKNTFQHL